MSLVYSKFKNVLLGFYLSSNRYIGRSEYSKIIEKKIIFYKFFKILLTHMTFSAISIFFIKIDIFVVFDFLKAFCEELFYGLGQEGSSKFSVLVCFFAMLVILEPPSKQQQQSHQQKNRTHIFLERSQLKPNFRVCAGRNFFHSSKKIENQKCSIFFK